MQYVRQGLLIRDVEGVLCTFVAVKQVSEFVRNACLPLNVRLRH